jgi:hypothetical protein
VRCTPSIRLAQGALVDVWTGSRRSDGVSIHHISQRRIPKSLSAGVSQASFSAKYACSSFHKDHVALLHICTGYPRQGQILESGAVERKSGPPLFMLFPGSESDTKRQLQCDRQRTMGESRLLSTANDRVSGQIGNQKAVFGPT